MIALALAGIRRRAAAHAAVFASVLIGASLLVTCGALLETGVRLPTPPVRLTEAPIVVTGDPTYFLRNAEGGLSTDARSYPEQHRMAPGDVGAIARVPGVAEAVPVVLGKGSVDGVAVELRSWSTAAAGPYRLQAGDAPTEQEVVLTTGLAASWGVSAGDRVEITSLGEVSTATVSGLASGTPETVFVAEDEHAELAPDAVAVLLDDGADADVVRASIEDQLPEAVAYAGDARGRGEDPAASASRLPTIIIGAVFGGIVLVVLGTVVSATVSLAVAQRRRELALLRSAGATSRQLRALVVSETAVVAFAGAVPGLALGVLVSSTVAGSMRGSGLLAASVQLSLGLLPFVGALAASVGAACLAAVLAARPVLRTTAVQAMREADLPSERLGGLRVTLGVLFVLGSLSLAVLTMLMPPSLVSATSGPAVLAACIAFALLAPPLVRVASRALAPVTRATAGRLATLAGIQVRSRSTQLATVATSVVLVVGLGAGHLVAAQLEQTAATDAALAALDADAVVTSPVGLSAETVDVVAEADGVDAASRLVLSGGRIERPFDESHPDAPWPLRGIDASGADVVAEAVERGTLRDLRDEAVAVPSAAAAQLGVGLGDTIDLRLGDGELVELEVVALVEARQGYEALYLPAELLAQHTNARVAQTMLVLGDPPTASVPQHAELSGAEGLRVYFGQALGLQGFVNLLLVGIAIAYAAVAVVNTLGVTILGRRRELALQRLTGSTRAQVRRMLTAELVVVAGAGIVGGAVAALAGIVPTAIAVGTAPITPAGLGVVGVLVGLVVALIAPVAHVAGTRALRGRAVEAVATG